MNYFRCTVGGSGKGNTVTVTCAEEFAGLTITLAKTGKTYTKTCPSTAPYVVTFYGVENGTYTVSATYDGRTYSESVVVKNIDCVLNYGFGWITWVNTAQYLDASDYASLDEVLEDEAAIRELFLEHACVDYMAEAPASNSALVKIINNDLCAKWINLSDYALDFLHANEVIADLMDEADKYGYGEWALMPQVPKMTSNTAPFGVASASSEFTYQSTTYYAWRAFDGTNNNEGWISETTNSWMQYKFGQPICIRKVKLTTEYYTSGNRIKNFKILASNDGSDFTELYVGVMPNASSSGLTTIEFDLENSNSYLYYRLFVVDTYESGARICVEELQFYAWAPKGNIPIMTANNAPYGTASAYRAGSNREAYMAFDENFAATDSYTSGANMSTSDYLQYKFTNPICAKRFYIVPVSATDLVNYSIKASNDGTNWTTLYSGTNESANPLTQNIDNDNYYLYYRITCDSTSGTYWFSIAKLQFYGRELKVSVPTMTSNTAPYGTASADSEMTSDACYAWKAFDGTNSNFKDCWESGNTAFPHWLGYDFGKNVCVKMFTIRNRNGSGDTVTNISAPKNFKLQGYDGSDWVDIETYINSTFGSNALTVYNVSEINVYKKFRIYITAKNVDYSGWVNLALIGQLQFYGLDYSEKEFANDGSKWLYDHGVELEEASALSTNATKGNNYLLWDNKTNIGSYKFDGFSFPLLDVTNFNLIRAKTGDIISSVTRAGYVQVSASLAEGTASLASVAITAPDSYAPNNHSLDISSVDQSVYVSVGDFNAQANARKLSIKELWLE